MFVSIAAQEFEVQSEFKMSFDFRTTRWDGVIMSISHPSGKNALALELKKGQVLPVHFTPRKWIFLLILKIRYTFLISLQGNMDDCDDICLFSEVCLKIVNWRRRTVFSYTRQIRLKFCSWNELYNYVKSNSSSLNWQNRPNRSNVYSKFCLLFENEPFHRESAPLIGKGDYI